MLTELVEDEECSHVRFHVIRNFLANEIYHFSGLSQQTGCIFTRVACSISSAPYSATSLTLQVSKMGLKAFASILRANLYRVVMRGKIICFFFNFWALFLNIFEVVISFSNNDYLIISIFQWQCVFTRITRFIANKLGTLVTLGSIFNTQTLKLLTTCFMFDDNFATIWVEISFNPGIVSSLLYSLELRTIKVCFKEDGW